ncbi:hypothetical protein SJ05684_c16390 [Sinorhizobium sojae CCBAU 05684]|uniref:Transmembrane protein n=1 Tax=Sinorhizobium sojae CCBAU 05684 TaxID=716928 RepID=A0A249PAZ7_9HYPH|nr:hypothetical protein [Sinorhizobium sojae]ASY63081.1 hypothetical protein SJ05684_c16390 [Sinorhizobium sojae CCBAU 05684]
MTDETPANRSIVVRRSARDRIVRAFPTFREVAVGSPFWAFTMALSAWHALWVSEHDATFHLREILLLYALGGLLAWPPSLFAARWLAQGRAFETRLAAFLLCLIAGTIGVTGCLFSLDYRAFYSQWHAAPGTRTWLLQFLFTSASAFYQFLVLGVRLYLPVGASALVLASLWLARSDGSQQR